jgi:hypothetical protein
MCKLAHLTTLTEQRALDAIDHASRHCSEPSVALDCVLRKLDGNVV